MKILEWKNLQLRLTRGEDSEAANLERHRPTGSSLNMDNAYIPGKMFFMPPIGAGKPVTFSDEQLAYLRAVNPNIADAIGTLDNDQRAQVKSAITVGIGLDEKTASKAAKKPAKGPLTEHELRGGMSPENRAKASVRMRKMLADRALRKQAAKDAGSSE